MLKKLIMIFVFVMTSVSQAHTAGLPKQERSRFVFKPGVEIPKRILRKFKHKSTTFYGAVAVSRKGKTVWFSTSDMNNARSAADVARLSCEVKAGPGGECEVVTLMVPESSGGTFDQAMKLSGISGACLRFLSEVRDPTRRNILARGQCYSIYVAGSEPPSSKKDGGKAGNTLYLARNDLYGNFIAYGPDALRVKEAALSGCNATQAAFVRGLDKRIEPQRRISNRADLEIEARVIQNYARTRVTAGKCRIVVSEILP